MIVRVKEFKGYGLGNLNIEEFDNVYEWWNFLADISSKAKSEDI